MVGTITQGLVDFFGLPRGGQVSCYPFWFSTTSSTDRMLVPRNGTALTMYVQRVFPLSKKILDGHYIIGSPSQRFVVKYTVLTTFVSRCIASHMVLLCSGFHSQSSPSGIPLYGGQTLSPSEPEYITKNATMMMDHSLTRWWWWWEGVVASTHHFRSNGSLFCSSLNVDVYRFIVGCRVVSRW